MAYVYLIDMFKLIETRLAETAGALEKLEDDPNERQFQKGRIAALSDFKVFLEDNYVPKLPRRIRQSYNQKKNIS